MRQPACCTDFVVPANSFSPFRPIVAKVSQQSLMPFAGRVLRSVAAGQDAQSSVVAPASSVGPVLADLRAVLRPQGKSFSLSADPRFLFRSPEHAPAFEELLSGIRRREGLITLTGEIGTGKTTLIRSVLQQLDRRTFSAFVPDPFVSREDLLKMLLVDFGVISVADLKRGVLSGASRPDLSYPLYEFLDSLVPLQAFAVLIIDEAQNLPLSLLEEIRILSDLEGREKLLQVVLVGQPELRASPQAARDAAGQSARFRALRADAAQARGCRRLHPASPARSQRGRPHRSSSLPRQSRAIYEGSGGTPRLINLICDRVDSNTAFMHALDESSRSSCGTRSPISGSRLALTNRRRPHEKRRRPHQHQRCLRSTCPRRSRCNHAMCPHQRLHRQRCRRQNLPRR